MKFFGGQNKQCGHTSLTDGVLPTNWHTAHLYLHFPSSASDARHCKIHINFTTVNTKLWHYGMTPSKRQRPITRDNYLYIIIFLINCDRRRVCQCRHTCKMWFSSPPLSKYKDIILSLRCVFSVVFYLTFQVQKETPDKIRITNNIPS